VRQGGPGADHQWQFLAAALGDRPHVIVVCSACGEARFSEVSESGGEDRRVDLSGDCPGRPHRRTMYETT
jgi:hypothetical protein